MKNLPLLLLFLISAGNIVSLQAQKLPSEQTATVALPPTFKIDGYAKEWGNKFQAHSKNTDLDYIVANNSQFLYLAVQATDPIIAKKIMGGGITFTINTTGERADKAPYSLTFPVIAESLQPSVFSTINDLTTEANQRSRDSLIKVANQKIELLTKEIRVKGFKTLPDSSLSIYNTTGIKSAARFNTDGLLICEFLVPLSLLDIPPNGQKIIAYNVMINGTTIIKSHNFGGAIVTDVPRSLFTQPSNTNIVQYSTDFWGNYTIKK